MATACLNRYLGQALVVVVFQRSGLRRLTDVRESAPVGDG